MPNLRHERVRELVKRELGEAIRREFNVEDSGLISVNDVDMAGDLKSAIVFVSIFGNASQQKRGLQSLEDKRARLQAHIAKSVVLKFTPTLKFIVDDSLVRGNRVLQILDELEKNLPVENSKPEGGPGDKP
ncbi:MAG TPA: 30S ribosome-binding factor RbfA [Verrucomicrobiae bacterium]|nr:30S ribosome-binding factor RbfA [Verrucomicrobiae bacterium]